MNKERIVILLISVLVLTSGYLVFRQNNQINYLKKQNLSYAQEKVEIQQALEAKIVYETLRIAIVEESIPTYNILTLNTDEIFVSTENIEDIKIPSQMGDYRLHKLTPEETMAKRESDGDFLYLKFTKFELDLEYSIVNIQTAGMFDSVGGLNLGFQQKGKVYGVWIS